jgi:hypothetical protein
MYWNIGCYMMSRKKRYTCEYYKDQQLTTDHPCPANTPCKSKTTQNCMKKLNDVLCPGCTTDQAPISDKKVVGQWLETGTPVGTSYNMISAGLMDANKGFYQPPGKINFPLTTKYRFITYGGDFHQWTSSLLSGPTHGIALLLVFENPGSINVDLD